MGVIITIVAMVLISFLFLCSFTCFSFFFLLRNRKRRQELLETIKSSSIRLQRLRALNAAYGSRIERVSYGYFPQGVHVSGDTLVVSVPDVKGSSKAEFDRTTCEKQMSLWLEDEANRESVRSGAIFKLHELAKWNDRVCIEYLHDVGELELVVPDGVLERYKLSQSAYQDIEDRVMQDEMLDTPVRRMAFISRVSYVSPAGRNRDSKSRTWSFDEVLAAAGEIGTEEEYKKSEKYRRKKARSAMTDKLRWKIIKRDGCRCVACGRGAADGVKLHVDHIIPVAKGGETVEGNLRTLCEDCNWGKSDDL